MAGNGRRMRIGYGARECTFAQTADRVGSCRWYRHIPGSRRDEGIEVKACVTGATGYVGGHVARLLADRGDEVRVTYRDERRLERLPRGPSEPGGARRL